MFINHNTYQHSNQAVTIKTIQKKVDRKIILEVRFNNAIAIFYVNTEHNVVYHNKQCFRSDTIIEKQYEKFITLQSVYHLWKLVLEVKP